ncbi:MAG: sugar phosphate isomerase/epimerase [Saprospiraceae bacterium]|nr:sugar phosphate isomerase/epimerase [Saprospiraceae bacterium]
MMLSCSSGDSKKEESGTSDAIESSTHSGTPFFKISLAQWSLHRALKGGQMDNLDFAAKTKNDFGIEAVEYVNQFFKDKAEDKAYLDEMTKRASDVGVEQLIIMIDGEGGLGDPDDGARMKAVENHYKWVEAAKYLGCHSIRVNAYGVGTAEDVSKAAVDGLGRLSTFAKNRDINVIVENHGGYSSDGSWLAGVMKQVAMDNCGTLPDFGNFCIERGEDGCANEYDRYKGVAEMMPYAKAVSAKSHDFDAEGNETHTDYVRMMKLVKDHGYHGYVGIEYEGSVLSEEEGIMATKRLLEKVGTML